MVYWQSRSSVWLSVTRRPGIALWRVGLALLAIVLIGLGNPLACFVHCWAHTHPSAASPASMPDHAHMHHDMAHAAMSIAQLRAMQQPAQGEPTAVDCLSHHETPSPLTIAVILTLLLVASTRIPTLPVRTHSLFLRLVAHPPPLQPPRLQLATYRAA